MLEILFFMLQLCGVLILMAVAAGVIVTIAAILYGAYILVKGEKYN